MLKTLASSRPSSQAIARLRREWELCRGLDHPNIVRYLSFETAEHAAAIVMEDINGVALAERIPARGLAIKRFLPIAIQLARGLAAIHAHGVLHKDVKPRNVLIDASERVRFIDFGVSAWLDDGIRLRVAPNRLEGTLAYISPEQTGRMNRALDHRADLYSLGITFYELLTGQVPFSATEALELVHCHLAKLPEPPHTVRLDIPTQLSRLVMKLISKAPEERYQSGRSLLYDLLVLREALAHDRDPPAFELGTRDRGPELRLPDRLFGRDRELQTLERAWGRAQRGQPTVVLVSGSSGVGKSALVGTFEQRLRDRAGAFIRGKFGQHRHHAAYEGFKTAFRTLAGRILGASMDEYQAWQDRLSEALAVNGRMLLDVVPEMEPIVGPLPASDPLGPEESQHRFNLVFRRFVRACARAGQPLTLFLDDVQWADPGSLALLELLASDDEQSHLMLVTAVRDDELDADHPTRHCLNRLRQRSGALVELPIRELGVADVEALLHEALGELPERTSVLAELIVERTAGNPLFVKTFLQTAWEEKLLTAEEHDPPGESLEVLPTIRWQWDSEGLRQMQASESVGELLARRLRQLPSSTRSVLRTAACLGGSFATETIAAINEVPLDGTITDLRAAARAGMILQRSDERWDFVHDRVREAAHALLPPDELAAAHLRIGRMLLADTPEDRLPERVFAIVDHLDIGRGLIDDVDELVSIAGLARLAGQRAHTATAYETAVRYLRAAAECLARVDTLVAAPEGTDAERPPSWRDHYALSLGIHRDLAVSEYLCDALDASRSRIEQALAHVDDAIDRVELYDLLVFEHTMATRYAEAIQVGREALELVGISLPASESSDQSLTRALADYRGHLGERAIASLIDLPAMTRRDTIAAARLLSTMISAAYSADHSLFPVLTLTLVNLSLAHGSLPEAAYGYAHHGNFVGSVLGDHAAANEWGELALALARRHKDLAQEARATTIVAGFLRPWVAPIDESEALIDHAHQAATESGQLQFIGYILYQRQLLHLFGGTALPRLEAELERALPQLHEINHVYAAHVVRSIQLNVAAMLGERPAGELRDLDSLEQELMAACRQSHSYIATGIHHIYRAQVAYLHGDPYTAVEAVAASKEYLPYVIGHVAIADRNFFHSLALAATLPEQPESERPLILATIEHNQAQLGKWAASAPANFAHKHQLVAAELARLDGDVLHALDLYEEAIANAHEHGFSQVHALASELAARMWLQRGQGNFRLARPFLASALASYRSWGARHKLRLLEAEFPELYRELSLPLRNQKFGVTSEPWVGTGSSQALDLATVTRASQAISSEIDLDRLLSKMMQIILLNAGANRGFLILESEDDFRVEASASSEVDEVELHHKRPLADAPLAVGVVRHVLRTGDNVVLEDAYRRGPFTSEPHVVRRRLKSVLCTPIRHKDALVGVLYLENEHATAAFTDSRTEVLQILLSQAAISLENARYYNELKTLNDQLRSRANELADSKTALEAEIVERERGEAQRLELEAQLRQSQKMEAIGQLAGGVAHDFNNLLTSIIGSTDLLATRLRQNAPSDPELRERWGAGEVHIIREAADHGSALTRQLLAFSRRQVMQPEVVELNGLVRRSAAILERLLGADHKLALELGEALGRVQVDPGQIEQVVLNLVINARDASPEGGVVRVDTKRIHLGESRPAMPEPIEPGDWIVLSVSDDGVGIDEETLARIFEPFFTTKEVGKGTGLGLSTVLGIVQQSTGHVRVDTKLGAGTRFEVWLPYLEAPAQPAKPRPETIEPAAAQPEVRETVLIVEDEAPVRRTVEQILTLSGYGVLIAEDGEACIELFTTRHAEIDLVLTDFVMPKLGGFDLVTRLREIDPASKILFMSGFSDQQLSRDKLDALAGVELIEKPFRARMLIDRIQRMLD